MLGLGWPVTGQNKVVKMTKLCANNLAHMSHSTGSDVRSGPTELDRASERHHGVRPQTKSNQ